MEQYFGNSFIYSLLFIFQEGKNFKVLGIYSWMKILVQTWWLTLRLQQIGTSKWTS